jgi:hypothetical protein
MRSVVGTGECERRQEDYEETCRRCGSCCRAVAMAPGVKRWTQATTKTLYGFTLKYAFRLPFEHTGHWLPFPFQQLTGQANGLSGIYERIAYTIRELQDDKAALLNRIEELEQGNPSAEVRRLRDENTTLRARLATAAKEKSEITWECDALLRKLNAIKLLVDGPAVRPFPSLHALL